MFIYYRFRAAPWPALPKSHSCASFKSKPLNRTHFKNLLFEGPRIMTLTWTCLGKKKDQYTWGDYCISPNFLKEDFWCNFRHSSFPWWRAGPEQLGRLPFLRNTLKWKENKFVLVDCFILDATYDPHSKALELSSLLLSTQRWSSFDLAGMREAEGKME